LPVSSLREQTNLKTRIFQGSRSAQAASNTIRLKLLKLGALVHVSVRRIKLAIASACPWQYEFALGDARLGSAAL